jgi:23S rRNA (cytidine1920-2'-O)/16S rRNA (cytidine1409-2'-O)-methyltransferase
MTKTERQRIDRLLIDRGLADSREKGQAMIIAGQVIVDGRKIEKVGTLVSRNADIRIIGERSPYVSRGGLKLEAALDSFGIIVRDRTALDIGASTGGFTDCLLQRGARKIYAVDVGYGQLAWRLRQDPRVVVIERTNIRQMAAETIPELSDIAVVDVSFISLEKVIPVLETFLRPGASLVALIKPQFEVGPDKVGKGGIVRDEEARVAAKERIVAFVAARGYDVRGVMISPITGQDGNVEYLLYAVRRPANSSPKTTMDSMSR